MNSYFNTFLNLDESIKKLLNDEHNSLEMKQFATSLKGSVNPCLEELTQSAARLKQFVLVGSNKLYHAENVLLSKPRIAEAPKQEIWEQLGEISGGIFKIRRFKNQLKSHTVEQARKYWDKRVDALKTTWFTDHSNGNKKDKDVAAWEKINFVKDIRLLLDLQSQDISLVLKESLKLVYKELEAINLGIIQNLVDLLDSYQKSQLIPQIRQVVSDIDYKFTNPTDYNKLKHQKLTNSVQPALEALMKQGLFSINLQQFSQFNAQVVAAIENIINPIFDDRVQLATEALEQAIAFYNDFLERQERYQQETPEQREAEKAWIDHQRQQLQQVQDGIEAILNAS